MKAFKIVFNILGILTAAFLSLLLFATLLTAPLVSSAASFLKSDTLYKVIKNIDITNLLNSSVNSQQQISAELLNELMETEFVEDVITLYTNNLFNALDQNNNKLAITSEDITTLTNKHFTELLPIVKAYIGTDLPIPDEELQIYAQQYIANLAPDIASMLPTLDDFGIDDSVITVLHNLHSGKTLKSLLIITGILSFLVFVCRFPRFKGFIWLGITYMCSAIVLFLFAFTVKSTGISLFTDLIPISKIIVTPFFSGLTSNIFKDAGIIFGIAVIFILIFILGRKLFGQKQAIPQITA